MEQDYSKWHQVRVAIRFADIDQLGHVNNAKYLTYLESARIAYFTDIVGKEINWNEEGVILARAEINFQIPVELGDLEVLVFTGCSKIGGKSFELSYVITKTDGKSICVTGSTTMVCYNYNEAKTIPVPEAWRKKLECN